ncbi:hypothetical protein GCM10010174_61230 [Kutzneria viridogrisea]|uniref:Uncharacterized protein n=1 Tax=Kutzneria viridogrisea TaxID=47990 RepID=A0ABR6BGE7_9PSEU|nr:hypothetical protein [Kutzneria viridogrisea]
MRNPPPLVAALCIATAALFLVVLVGAAVTNVHLIYGEQGTCRAHIRGGRPAVCAAALALLLVLLSGTVPGDVPPLCEQPHPREADPRRRACCTLNHRGQLARMRRRASRQRPPALAVQVATAAVTNPDMGSHRSGTAVPGLTLRPGRGAVCPGRRVPQMSAAVTTPMPCGRHRAVPGDAIPPSPSVPRGSSSRSAGGFPSFTSGPAARVMSATSDAVSGARGTGSPLTSIGLSPGRPVHGAPVGQGADCTVDAAVPLASGRGSGDRHAGSSRRRGGGPFRSAAGVPVRRSAARVCAASAPGVRVGGSVPRRAPVTLVAGCPGVRRGAQLTAAARMVHPARAVAVSQYRRAV